MEPEEKSIARKGLGQHFPAKTKQRKNVIARVEIIGKQPAAGRRKHVPVEMG
jgi:hypothetical protein